VGSRTWARRLVNHGLPQFPATARPGGRLALPELDLEIGDDQAFALGAYGHLWDLRACGFDLLSSGAREVEISGRGVRARLNSVEECFIFREIFADRIYDVQPAAGARVIDIGMNIGLASLFFASVLPDCRIDAFEPFSATFARAQYQMSLNPGLAARITPHPFGLWSASEHRRIGTDAGHKGSTGIWGVQAGVAADSNPKRECQEIELREAAGVLGPILDAARGGPAILKLDAEGSEYGIFDRLDAAGLADRFDIILMEWHRNQPTHDPLRLRELLGRLGYRSLCHQYLHRPFGMIYAFRSPRQ
jgi:FkbM family methyltransferase